MISTRTPSPRLVLASLCAVVLAACSSSDDDSGFSVTTTDVAASPSAPLVVTGDWLVFFASEGFTGPAGTNLNANGNDLDVTDQVAFAGDLRARTETNLGVAALGAAILGDQLYLVVDETLDSFDWNGVNGIGDIVLLHWSKTAAVVTFVDTLDQGSASEVPLAASTRLYYAADVTAPGVDETTLRYVTEAAPTTPVTVLNEAGAGAVEAHLLAEETGLLFCSLDETDDAIDLNGDGDTNDENVLALLDPTDANSRVKSVELALEDDSVPFAARSLAAHDWLVAFLVDEQGQGATNLNDQTLFSQPLLPETCPSPASDDTDANDQVLHYLDFSDFLASLAGPVNTGLAGHDRVLVLDGSPNDFVATISDEGDSNCNLNDDADSNDDVARWVEVKTPIAPARGAADLHALATGIGGGSFGLSTLSTRLIAVIDEEADSTNLDGKVIDHDLVAWLDPDSAPTWHVSHQSSSSSSFGTGVFDSDGDSEPFAGTSWMAAESVDGRLGLVFLEEVPGTNPNVGSLNSNLDCNLVNKDSDKVDGLPVWADFESGPTLDFDGMGYAVDEANAGIVIAAGFAFFRVSEADDNHDYNLDGDKTDVVLFRNPLTTCGPIAMQISTSITGPVIATDNHAGAAFLSSETQAGQDLNGDADLGDIVVSYFRF